jgi:hypothetical protein
MEDLQRILQQVGQAGVLNVHAAVPNGPGERQAAAPTLPAAAAAAEGGCKEEEDDDAEQDVGGNEVGVNEFKCYTPTKVLFDGRGGEPVGVSHPDPVVETSSLNAVELRTPSHSIALPRQLIERGLLSTLQLESVVCACQCHESLLELRMPEPTNEDGRMMATPKKECRRGFLIGDGAGVGKGRQIAALVYENFLRGREKAVWFSVSSDLLRDARRDFKDVGLGKVTLFGLQKIKIDKEVDPEKGVMFCTYSLLIRSRMDDEEQSPKANSGLAWWRHFRGCFGL